MKKEVFNQRGKTGSIMEEILKKYGLWESQEEGLDKFFKSKISDERVNLFENLPSSKINTLITKYADGKISLDQFPSILEKELDISVQESKKLAKEIENEFLISITPIKEKGGEKIPPTKIPPPEEKPSTPSTEEKKSSPRKDVYRESIE